MDKLLPKDSCELARLEKLYGMPTTLFQAVCDVNDVVKSTDKEEILDGDHQITHADMRTQTIVWFLFGFVNNAVNNV